jgi:acetyltransferase
MPLFAPRGIAVIGASTRSGKLGAVMTRSLRDFAGELALVNSRNADPSAGVFPSAVEAVREAGGPIDLAVLCVPAAESAAALAGAAAAGIRAAVVCAGGFAESGGEGIDHQRALLDVAASTGMRLLGPNTSGFLAPHRNLTVSFVPGALQVPPGNVAVVATSGGLNHALAFLLAEAGTGISLAVGLGNGIDVTAADVLDHLAGDPSTAAVALHLEAVTDGRRLVRSLARLTPTRPVVALVAGRSDVGDFARSHTGALATSWRTARAALRQAGAVVVDDERQLVDAVTALSRTRLTPRSEPGVALVTAQAGPGLLVADGLRSSGVAMPELSAETQLRLLSLLPPLTYQRNPVDTGRPGGSFAAVLAAVGADPAVDLLAVYALAEPDSLDLVRVAAQAQLGQAVPAVVATGGPSGEVQAIRERLHERGIAVLSSPTALAVAVRALVEDARGQAHPLAADRRVATTAVRIPRRPLDEHEAKALLADLGVTTLPRRACGSREEAHRALRELEAPVVVKILSAAVLHKSDIGGVRLGVRTAMQLDAALDALERAGARRYLVETMAPDGVDLIAGARRDPVFGPVVLLGIGGTAAEALGDVTVRLAPLDPPEASRMPDELAGRSLLGGWRGMPALDRPELAAVLCTLGDLMMDAPWLSEVEINPLRLTDAGLVALDAVITLDEEDGHASADR